MERDRGSIPTASLRTKKRTTTKTTGLMRLISPKTYKMLSSMQTGSSVWDLDP
jgi:hypothetical protein